MNINLKSFYDISHNRTYNQGSVYVHKNLFGGSSLYRANHHRYLPNWTTLTPAQNREVRQAFATALQNEKGLAPGLLRDIRERLGLGGTRTDVAATPLERREIKAIFDMLEARRALQAKFISGEGGRSEVRRMLDDDIAARQIPQNRLGSPAFDHAMRNLAISCVLTSVLNETFRNPGMTLTDDEIRNKVFAEYDLVWQDFHGVLSEHEEKGVYRHLALVGLNDDPVDNPNELLNALALLDRLEEEIPGLAEMDDAAAARAVYEKLRQERGEPASRRPLSELGHVREIRRFVAAEAADVARGNRGWVNGNWDGGERVQARVAEEFARTGLPEDRLGVLEGEVGTRLQACQVRIADMSDHDRNVFVDECIRSGVEAVQTQIARELARERNLATVRDDPVIPQATKDTLVEQLRELHLEKCAGVSAAIIALARLDYSAELDAFLAKPGGSNEADVRNLALALSRKMVNELKTRYPALAQEAEKIADCAVTVLAGENESFQLAVVGMRRSDLNNLGDIIGFQDEDGRTVDDLNSQYHDMSVELQSVSTSDLRRAQLEAEMLELKARLDALNVGYHFVQGFDRVADDVREQLLAQNLPALRLTEELSIQAFDILERGDGTEQSDEHRQRIRDGLGGTFEDVRREIRCRFFRSPKLMQVVRNLTSESLDPALVATFRRALATELQNYDGPGSLFRSGGPVDEFFRVRAKGNMFDTLVVGGRPIPARPVSRQQIESVMPAKMLESINSWTRDQNPDVQEAKRERCLAFVEAVYNEVGGDMGRVIAVCSLLGLNGAQMSFNFTNQMNALKTGENPSFEFMTEAANRDLSFDITGPAKPPLVPAQISFDRSTGRVRVSVGLTRGFSVAMVNGTSVIKGVGVTAEKVGMEEKFQVGIELGNTIRVVEEPVQGSENPLRFNIPEIVVTSIEKEELFA